MFRFPNTELKITLTQAVEEAREHGHHRLGTDHVLLAMLTNVRGSTFAVLTEAGLDYATARQRLLAHHEQQPRSEGEQGAGRAANLDADREALKSIGIDLDAVREAVSERFGTDITDNWGERRRPAGGPRRGRGPGRGGPGHPHEHHGHHEHGHGPGGRPGPHDEYEGPRGPGRGRRGPRGAGRPRFTEPLRAVLDDVREGLREDLHERRRDDESDPRAAFASLPMVVLAGLLRSEDPALDAVLEGVDRAALLRAVDEACGATL
ncbi:Clp protease N-terminal domain-containing protein [Dermacoccaceae bacterium W4C1]